MITENEIRNQLEIAKTKKENEDPRDWDELDKWSLYGYIHALAYVLGKVRPKFDKEDI